ncbi:MAG: general secretion pathway protein GspM, partial [Desulfobacula sp.]|nr:general secretion pathway protein GspM [Desulfobacula sp.]
GVKENVAYMKPFTKKLETSLYILATVKVKLKEVYLKELVDFLYHIESSKNGVTITSLSLSKAGKEKVKLDAVVETQTLMQKEKP